MTEKSLKFTFIVVLKLEVSAALRVCVCVCLHHQDAFKQEVVSCELQRGWTAWKSESCTLSNIII